MSRPANSKNRRKARQSRAHRPTRLLGEALESRTLLTTTIELVENINAAQVGVEFSSKAVEVNGVAYFRGNDGIHGEELWRTDGTAKGTYLVKDLTPGIGDSSPYNLTNVNGRLFFTTHLGPLGYPAWLWTSDGTVEGTTRLAPVEIPSGQPLSPYLTAVNDTLYFTNRDQEHGRELWKSDGTVEGTVLFKDIVKGSGYSDPQYLTNVNGTLFFAAWGPGEGGKPLWKSDGTPEGTVIVKNVVPGPGHNSHKGNPLLNVNGTLFFGGTEPEFPRDFDLWKSDGTAEGTVRLHAHDESEGMLYPVYLTNVSGTVFFRAKYSGAYELWKSDGTPEGTTLVKDGFTPLDRRSPRGLWNANGKLFFSANDGAHGSELWVSDGTSAGTNLVKDIQPGTADSELIVTPTNVGGTLFFNATDGSFGSQLWKTDGTSEGTVLVSTTAGHDFGPDDHYLSHLTSLNGAVLFAAPEARFDRRLWRSDGTPEGTRLVQRGSDDRNSDAGANAELNGAAYFAANDGIHGHELWKTDPSGVTVLVKDIQPGPAGSHPSSLANINGTLFFATQQDEQYELWKSDGTPERTVLVASLDPAVGGLKPESFTNVNGTLFFVGHDPAKNRVLWKSNGTAQGTVVVQELNDLYDPRNPFQRTMVNGTLFYQATDFVRGAELWKTNGVSAPVRVADVQPGERGSFPHDLTNLNGVLYFVGYVKERGEQLWKSDGTAAGTVLVKDFGGGEFTSFARDIINVNGTLFFAAEDRTHGEELWKSDGTTAGTVMVKDVESHEFRGFYPRAITNVNGTVYFFKGDGRELWKSDGTEQGTVRVQTFFSDASQHPRQAVGVQGTLFFTIDNGANGAELWRSNGSAEGTTLVKDIFPGFAPGDPTDLFAFADKLLFTANDGLHGREPWLVTEVNSPPIFVKGPDQNTTDESGPQSAPNWATLLSVGPAEEAGQAIRYLVSADRPELFAVQPAIDATGQLTFTPASNASGTALVTVRLQDSGGAGNGGADTSPPQTFTIQISKPRWWHNVANPPDVSGDGGAAADDALTVINFLNAFGSQPAPATGTVASPFYDVTGDGTAAPDDALAIINHLNTFGPDGEGEPSLIDSPSEAVSGDLLELLALDLEGQSRKRR